MIKVGAKNIKDLIVNSSINPTACSKNNYFIRKLVCDPLINPFLSISLCNAIMEMCEYLINNA